MGKKKTEDYHSLPSFERKELPTFIKSYDEDKGIVTHFVAIMGNVDSVSDRIVPGAFRKTISERKDRIRVLDQHLTDSVTRIVGKPLDLVEVGREELTPEVLKYAPDATGGLLAVTQYAIETSRGRDVFKLVKGGFAPESSIGYDAITFDFVEEKDADGSKRKVRELKEIRLWEYSNVIFGCNPATTMVSAKSDPIPSESKPAPEVTENTIRIRVHNPGDFEEDSFSTINIGGEDSGIQATVGKLTGETTMTIQSYVFDKEEFTVEEAQAWVDEHKKDGVPDIEEKATPGKADWPLASRDRAWDATAAEGRIRSWAGAEEEPNAKYASCFFWNDAENASNFTAYKLLFCDIVGGQVQAIPRGIFAVAGVLSGARGGADIPEADQAKIRGSVAGYYARMRTEFEDDGIVPPWEKSDEPASQVKAPTEAEVFAAIVMENVGAKLAADTWEHKAISLAIEKLRDGWGDANADRIAELEQKVGRVLAARNAQRIGAAVASLIQVMEDAGIDIPGFGREPPAEEEESDMELGKSLRLQLDILGAELDMMEFE